MQPQTPAVPPPAHARGNAHVVPPQQGWPLPPQTPQSTPHALPLAHEVQVTPPLPNALCESPLSQLAPSQHPAHEVASHLHTPCAQRWPCPHAAVVHTPSQPLLAPHALPVQLPVHAPTPHTLGLPPPPQSIPMLQPPQSTS
jgi:hypothetical protein